MSEFRGILTYKLNAVHCSISFCFWILFEMSRFYHISDSLSYIQSQTLKLFLQFHQSPHTSQRLCPGRRRGRCLSAPSRLISCCRTDPQARGPAPAEARCRCRSLDNQCVLIYNLQYQCQRCYSLHHHKLHSLYHIVHYQIKS
jgi:hypothetical protein